MGASLTRAMSGITAIVLAAFLAYGAAWYFGAVEGNFSLLLFLAALVTGVSGWLSVFTFCHSAARRC